MENQSGAVRAGTSGQTQKETILVVDDEPNLRKILKFQLEASDFRVFTAENGVEAVGRVDDLASLAGPDRIGLAPIRVSSGFLLMGLSGNTRIQTFPPRFTCRVIAIRAASI